MPVPVMQVGIVRMGVHQSGVPMRMRMGLDEFARMRVMMMRVVRVSVLMLQIGVLMRMLVIFGKM